MPELHLHHEENHMQSSETLRDIVIGMSDGLTVPFALDAGLSGAVQSTNLIIIAGLAEIAAGSIAMGLGGYLAGKTEVDHYNSEMRREYEEVATVPEIEKPDPKRAGKSAFNIGMLYIVGGLIPLSPYFFVSNGLEGLKISSVITLICLFIFGYFKSKFTGVNKLGGAFRVMMIGAVAAGCAFAIARLIQGRY